MNLNEFFTTIENHTQVATAAAVVLVLIAYYLGGNDKKYK